MPIVSITPISGNQTDINVQTGEVKRTRKLLVQTAPEISPTEGTEVWPDVISIENALADFGYPLAPVVPFWGDDLGFTDPFSILHTVKIEQSSDMGEAGFWIVTMNLTSGIFPIDRSVPYSSQPRSPGALSNWKNQLFLIRKIIL